MVTIEKIVFGFMTVFAACIAYAMDWQREQDAQLSGFRELIQEQKTLLRLQQEYQKNQVHPQMSPGFNIHTIPPHLGTIDGRSWSNAAPPK